MVCITKLISYNNCHSIISSILDLSLIVKLLLEDIVFDYQSTKENNKSEFTNIYLYETKSIAIEDSLNLYQYKIRKK